MGAGAPPPGYIQEQQRKAAEKKARDKNAVETNARAARDGAKNGMGTGKSVEALTNGGITTRPRTGVVADSLGFNPGDPKAVKDVQRFLVSRGYKLTVDGKFGPHTKSAFENFTLKPGEQASTRNVRSWNAKNATPNVPDAAIPAATAPSADPSAAPVRRTQGAGSGGGIPAGLESILASIASLSGVDPNLASNQANAEFDPAIKEASRQLGLTTAQKGQDQTDIGDWFKALVGQNQQGNQADTAALKQVLGDSSGLMKNVLGSLSDGTAKEMVGRTALTNEGMLKGIGLAEGNYNRNMDTALALTGRDQMNRQGKADTNQIDQARATLLDVIGHKGAALVGYGNQNRQQAVQNQTNLFNLMASAAMLPGQMQQQGLDGILTQAKVASLLNPAAKPGPKYNLQKLIDQAGYGIGVANMRLPKGSNLKSAASTIGVVLKGAGLKPGSNEWRQVGSQILGSFQTPDGKPITVPNNWFSGANF